MEPTTEKFPSRSAAVGTQVVSTFPLRCLKALIAREEEQLVFDGRPTAVNAELILGEGRTRVAAFV